jgi:hypothetical protein
VTSSPVLPNRWKRRPENPLLSLRPGKFDAYHIHAPMVILENGVYRMWYSGSDKGRGGAPSTTASGMPRAGTAFTGSLWMSRSLFRPIRPARTTVSIVPMQV